MKKPNRKMDANFVSNQAWEIQYIALKFGITCEMVRMAKKLVGKSRRKIYNYIKSKK